MSKLITVTYKGKEEKKYPVGVTLKEISKDFSKYYKYPVLISEVNNNIRELNEEVLKNIDVDFFDRTSNVGLSTYGRTLQFILVYALKRINARAKLRIENSIDKGFYREVSGIELNKPLINALQKAVEKIVLEKWEIIK